MLGMEQHSMLMKGTIILPAALSHGPQRSNSFDTRLMMRQLTEPERNAQGLLSFKNMQSRYG